MCHHTNKATILGLCSALAACSQDPTAIPAEPEAVRSETAGAVTQSTNLLQASNTWTTKQSLSPWRSSMAAGTINGTIYVVGGWRRDMTPLARVDAYRVATNTWSQVASLPSARAEVNGASMINGKLYVTGGSDRNRTATRTLFVYDPQTNRWTRKADMPRPSCDGDQGVIAGMLYVYTGCYAKDNAGMVFFRYNPMNDSWARRAAPPVDHHWGAGAVANGKFYLAGGFKPSCNLQCIGNHSEVSAYNPATNTWMAKSLMPNPGEFTAAATLNGRIYLAGGTYFGEISDKLRVYDPSTDGWTYKASMPESHSAGAAAVAGGRLFYIGGLEWLSPPEPSKVYAYTP
jgi:N-acetylneuraminic acid mutarotase